MILISDSSSPHFAPYFDVTLQGPTLSQIAEKTGQLDYTLAFALGGFAGCDPKWGAEKDLDDSKIIDEIRKVQAKGGRFIVALGGKFIYYNMKNIKYRYTNLLCKSLWLPILM